MSARITQDTVREWGRRYSNWGRWGPDDEKGALNFITPACILAATALPRRGQVISCALPFDQNGPQTGVGGRHNPIHYMLPTAATRSPVPRISRAVFGMRTTP